MDHGLTLCIDIGNTNTVFGVVDASGVRAQWRIATELSRMPDEYGLIILGLLGTGGISAGDIAGIALSSVVPPLTPDFIKLCRRYYNREPLVVGPGVELGLEILYEDPRQVGADRIVNALSVKERFGGPACIIDFGTATTFDALNERGAYMGGAIAPGILIAAEALFSRAARLSKVDIRAPGRVIGRNTEESVQSGVLYGYVAMVEGMVQRFGQELGPNMRVIATGGLAELVARHTSVIELVDPALTLDGLYRIYQLNRGH